MGVCRSKPCPPSSHLHARHLGHRLHRSGDAAGVLARLCERRRRWPWRPQREDRRGGSEDLAEVSAAPQRGDGLLTATRAHGPGIPPGVLSPLIPPGVLSPLIPPSVL